MFLLHITQGFHMTIQHNMGVGCRRKLVFTRRNSPRMSITSTIGTNQEIQKLHLFSRLTGVSVKLRKLQHHGLPVYARELTPLTSPVKGIWKSKSSGRWGIWFLCIRVGKQWRIQGRGPSSPLIFRPDWGPGARKKFFWKTGLPLSKGLDDRPPPSPLSQGPDPALS